MANIALGKPILENTWLRPEDLTNGNFKDFGSHSGYTHSRWPVYLTVDLLNTYQIETIRFLLWNKDQRVYKYRLLTSSDSQNWFVYFDGSESGYQGWQEFSFPDKISVRYIRIHCLWNSNNEGFHIVQLQVFDNNTEILVDKISNKKIFSSISNESIDKEINDGLPLTQKMNDLTNKLEKILKEYSIINPEPIKDIIKKIRIQAFDIESLEKNIDSIRREIIYPVQNKLEEGNRLGRFSVLGFYVGFVGIVVSVFAILNGIFCWI